MILDRDELDRQVQDRLETCPPRTLSYLLVGFGVIGALFMSFFAEDMFGSQRFIAFGVIVFDTFFTVLNAVSSLVVDTYVRINRVVTDYIRELAAQIAEDAAKVSRDKFHDGLSNIISDLPETMRILEYSPDALDFTDADKLDKFMKTLCTVRRAKTAAKTLSDAAKNHAESQ